MSRNIKMRQAVTKQNCIFEQVRLLVIKCQLLWNNKLVKGIGYAVYALGALIGAFLRSSLGRPLMIQLKGIFLPSLTAIEVHIERVAMLGYSAFVNLLLVFRHLFLQLGNFWAYLTRLANVLANGM